ncbi:MAG: hypothetical protein K2Z25_22475 [Beijerinckiaceae bacterium]|nr:hypothetical protein [Beijerinckiaceae bacterium]
MSQVSTPRRETQPDGSVRIWFAAPILHHAEPKGFVTLREPMALESWQIGDPVSYIYDDRGYGTPYVDRERLLQWIRLLIVDHDADILGRERDLALSFLIEETVLGFFRQGRTRLRPPSEGSPAQESALPRSNA